MERGSFKEEAASMARVVEGKSVLLEFPQCWERQLDNKQLRSKRTQHCAIVSKLKRMRIVQADIVICTRRAE